jgi:hypothetical protein
MWLDKNHPDVKLTTFQHAVVRLLYSQLRGTDKTFLLALLVEFDKFLDYENEEDIEDGN